MKRLLALFSLLILLFVVATEARQNPQICSSSCGNIHNISYPFRLKDAPIGCGDPDFELSCQNNRTILNFHGGLYYVKRISYPDHRLHVVDVNLANGSCGLPYRSLSRDEVEADGRYPGWIDYNHWYALNYLRCSNNISQLANARVVPCLSGNTSQVYVYTINYTSPPPEVPSPCKVIATTQALYKNKVEPLSYETVLKMQESGFEMRWSVECRDCREKGRGCVFTFKDSDFLYECEEEYDYDAVLRWIYTVFSAMFLSGAIGFVRFFLLPLVVFGFLLHKFITTRD